MNFRYDSDNEKLIVSQASRIEYHQIGLWLTRKVKGWRFHPAVKVGAWDGNMSYFEDGKVNVGLWKECLNACREIGVKFNVENREEFPLNREVTIESVREFCLEFFKLHQIKDKKSGEWKDFTPHDYQIETAYKILKNRYCIGEVATSGGKSLIISIIFFYILKNINPDAKFLIIVPSISLVTQFYDNILEYNYGENNIEKIKNSNVENIFVNSKYKPCDLRVEEIMSEKPRKHSGTTDANIYIGTYQSLEKWPKEWFKQFYGVVCDESHQAKAKTLINILQRTFKSAYYRFGVSGTFPNDDTCEILAIQSVLGPKVSQIEASLLVEKGTITPMHIKALFLNYNEVELNKQLKSIRNPNNGREIYEYEKKFIQASDKRIEFIRKLVEKKCNSNTLLLFHTIEYGKRLFEEISKVTDIDVFYIDGEVSGKKRQEIFNEMNKTDKVKLLVASYGTLSTGVSINSIQNVIFADSFKSESLIIQSIGRSLRKFDGKNIAIIWDIVDVLDIKEMNNVFCRQFNEREKFYIKRKYPYDKIKVNI